MFGGIGTEAAAFASALDWWADAGVDVCVDDAPRRWGGPSSATPADTARRVAGPVPSVAPAPSTLPSTLPVLVALLMEEAVCEDFGRPARRFAPGGPTRGTMVLTDMPEDDDRTGLLTGRTGALFDRMLGALKLSRDGLYLASLTPCRTPTGRLDNGSFAHVADLARAHVRLVAPTRLWLLGEAASRAILGRDATRTGQAETLDLGTGPIRVIATAHPRTIRPELRELRAHVWATMQRLIEE